MGRVSDGGPLGSYNQIFAAERAPSPQMIAWKGTLETGHPLIDRDHQVIIAALNKLEEALSRDAGKEEFEQFIRFLEGYAREHFSREEGYMLETRCPAFGENCQAHKAFQGQMDEWISELRSPGVSKDLAVRAYVQTSKWICRHIMLVDCKLKPCAVHPVGNETQISAPYVAQDIGRGAGI